MKEYIKPVMELTELEEEDIVTVSGGIDTKGGDCGTNYSC